MSKGVKWTIIGVIIAAVLGGIAFFGYVFFKYKQDVKVPEVKKVLSKLLKKISLRLTRLIKKRLNSLVKLTFTIFFIE